MQSQYIDSPNLAGVSSLNRQRLTLIKSVQPQKLFGARPAGIGSHQVDVTDPSRTIVDVLGDPAVGGGMAHVSTVVAAYFDHPDRDDDLLLAYIEQHGNKAIYKRLGYLVEALGIDAPELEAVCRLRISRGVSQLDASASPNGRRCSDWNLQINVTLPNIDRL